MQQDPNEGPLDLARLLEDAVAEAVSHEDAERFMAWFRDHIADYRTETPKDDLLDAAFVAVLGRSIWNALPLPGSGFNPRPFPEPGRNDPCFCGSGEKYKRCCAQRPSPPLDPEHILPTVLDHTPAETLARQIQSGRVPVNALIQVAGQRFERGELWNTVDLLEPLFAGDLQRADEHYGAALEILCDVYAALGHQRKTEALLAHVVASAKRSALRADAWQRIAVARLDQGDTEGAWEAFDKARHDHPDAPAIGLLELQLLMSQGRTGEAGERAAFWEKRLRKQGLGDEHRLVSFFAAMTRDPQGVMADMGIKAAGGAGERLIQWVRTVADRALPDYGLADGPAGNGFTERILRLVAPDSHSDLQAHWHAVFPLPKPYSIEEAPAGPDSPWDPTIEQTWMDFLAEHPDAFDSLDILDDLATALIMHPQFGAHWLDRSLLEPVLDRAEAIINHALRDRTEPRLAWRSEDNRPALRSLARRAYLLSRRGDEAAAARARDRLLALNPDDDHGLRNPAIEDPIFRRGE